MGWKDDDTPEQAAAKAEMEEALIKYMRLVHEDDTLVLTGYLLQSMAAGLNDKRDLLVYTGLEGQSSISSLGLLSYLETNVNMVVFDDEEDE